jgi:crotonobetainyl-CoA:carnitine CoA-transferase CaiB-like acyl-CoA transferase
MTTALNINFEILEGIRVLDFSRVLAGPYATRILADFGADVIKVQARKTAQGTEADTSAYFSIWNRNKRSMTLDMSHPEAREVALNLMATCDVVVENFSPRVMSNWELTYDDVKSAKADIIMLSMSAMGQDGPWKDYVAYGPTVQALGGLTYLTSYGPDVPVGSGFAYADPMAGLYGAFVVLAALECRERTGKGLYIDLSEYEVAASLIGPELMQAFMGPADTVPKGNRSAREDGAPYGCYRCLGEDRWCVIAVFDEMEWQALCKVFGSSRWISDKRFFDAGKRKTHAGELDELIERETLKYPPDVIVSRLQRAGVPAGIVNDAEDLANDPHLLSREFFYELHHPVHGKTVSDRSPIRFRESSRADDKPSPRLGEDNRYVYMELLGLSEAEYAAYLRKGIID